MVYKGKVVIFPVVYALVQPLLPPFDELVTKEGKLIDVQQKNPYTARIVEADKLNDRLTLGIKESIVAAMRHYDPSVSAAAVRLNDRLKAFGRIDSKAYEEEAGAISLLVAELKDPVFAPDVATVGLTGWVSQLEIAVENFKKLLELRNNSIAPELTKDNIKIVRREAEAFYHRMVKRINAAAELDDTGQYELFIQQINAEIRYFNEHTHSSAKKDLGEGDCTVINPIPVQNCTGMDITPLPVVWYHEKEKEPVLLTFTKDFTLSYKNNRNVGMADLTVHGKGAYKGSKSTTFSIVHSNNQ
jgi:hypothetical protein